MSFGTEIQLAMGKGPRDRLQVDFTISNDAGVQVVATDQGHGGLIVPRLVDVDDQGVQGEGELVYNANVHDAAHATDQGGHGQTLVRRPFTWCNTFTGCAPCFVLRP